MPTPLKKKKIAATHKVGYLSLESHWLTSPVNCSQDYLHIFFYSGFPSSNSAWSPFFISHTFDCCLQGILKVPQEMTNKEWYSYRQTRRLEIARASQWGTWSNVPCGGWGGGGGVTSLLQPDFFLTSCHPRQVWDDLAKSPISFSSSLPPGTLEAIQTSSQGFLSTMLSQGYRNDTSHMLKPLWLETLLCRESASCCYRHCLPRRNSSGWILTS